MFVCECLCLSKECVGAGEKKRKKLIRLEKSLDGCVHMSIRVIKIIHFFSSTTPNTTTTTITDNTQTYTLTFAILIKTAVAAFVFIALVGWL